MFALSKLNGKKHLVLLIVIFCTTFYYTQRVQAIGFMLTFKTNFLPPIAHVWRSPWLMLELRSRSYPAHHIRLLSASRGHSPKNNVSRWLCWTECVSSTALAILDHCNASRISTVYVIPSRGHINSLVAFLILLLSIFLHQLPLHQLYSNRPFSIHHLIPFVFFIWTSAGQSMLGIA